MPVSEVRRMRLDMQRLLAFFFFFFLEVITQRQVQWEVTGVDNGRLGRWEEVCFKGGDKRIESVTQSSMYLFLRSLLCGMASGPWYTNQLFVEKLYFGDRTRFFSASYQVPGQQLCEQTTGCLGYSMQIGRFIPVCNDAALNSCPLAAGRNQFPRQSGIQDLLQSHPR